MGERKRHAEMIELREGKREGERGIERERERERERQTDRQTDRQILSRRDRAFQYSNMCRKYRKTIDRRVLLHVH